MNLSTFNVIFDHKIVGGSEQYWTCYPDSRYLDYESAFAKASVIVNTESGLVYEATIESIENPENSYYWINPDFKTDMINEAVDKKLNPDHLYFGTELEVIEDFAEKADAIFHGEEFDHRVIVPITLSNDEMLKLMTIAHEKDITLNELVSQILEQEISQQKAK
jgi:hypothetical protein